MPLKLEQRIVVFFTLVGMAAGLVSVPLTGKLALAALFLSILIFYLSYRLAPRLLRFDPSQVEGGWSGRSVLSKYWDVYFFMWFVFWVLAYTDYLRL